MGLGDWCGDLFDLLIFISSPNDSLSSIRVKYLDEIDIEALGGRLTREEKDNPNKIYHFGNHSLIFNSISRWCIITIMCDIRKECYVAHVSIVKNKSELKRLFYNHGVIV